MELTGCIESIIELEEKELSLNTDLVENFFEKLLALYLCNFDTLNAKFLWKRIPDVQKAHNLELQNVWKIGQLMWKRDFSNVILATRKFEWSLPLQSIMTVLRGKVRNRLVDIVSKAYSSIMIERLSVLLCMDQDEVTQLAISKNWEVDMGKRLIKIVFPNETCIDLPVKSDELLATLTDYITFLEN